MSRFARPFGVQKPVLIFVFHVRTIGSVNRNSPSARNETDDFIARHGITAPRETNQKPVHSLYGNVARGVNYLGGDTRGIMRNVESGFLFIEIDNLEKYLIYRYRAATDSRVHFVVTRKREFSPFRKPRGLKSRIKRNRGFSLPVRASFFRV